MDVGIKKQLKPAISIFWKLFFAEYHWPELDCLFNNSETFSPTVTEHRQNILDYQHNLDWLFFRKSLVFSNTAAL